jgi:uncharacterized protein YxjI
MEANRSLAVSASSPPPRELTRRFDAYQRLTVRQRKKWLEILFSFEFRNHYDVFDRGELPVLHVAEQGGGFMAFLKRTFLGPLRPFEVLVTDSKTNESVLALRRPFRFFLHRLEVATAAGERLGAIQRRWSWLRRIYVIEDANGQVIADIFGPILRPWTFELRVNEKVLGTITKKWSGLFKEAFSDADNFGVDLGALQDPQLKTLAFAATVLIDVCHFERSKG